MPSPVRIVEILSAAQAACASHAKQLEGEHALKQKDNPGRMVWQLDEAQTSGGPPRGAAPEWAFHKDRWTLTVHCWGRDLAGALRLRQAAITAVAEQITGDHENYRVTRTEVHGDAAASTEGRCAIVTFELDTLLMRADLTQPEIEDARFHDFAQADAATIRGGISGDERLTANQGDEP